MNDTPQKPASQIRRETYEQVRCLHRLLKYPDCQPEVIAKHYAAMAQTAMHLLKLIEHNKHFPSSEAGQVIAFAVKEIKNAHLHDFGLELEWRDTP